MPQFHFALPALRTVEQRSDEPDHETARDIAPHNRNRIEQIKKSLGLYDPPDIEDAQSSVSFRVRLVRREEFPIDAGSDAFDARIRHDAGVEFLPRW